MKRIPLLTLLILAAPLLFCGQTTDTKAQQSKVMPDAEIRFVSPIKGWSVAEEALQDYAIGIDTSVKHGGKASAFAKSKSAGSTNRAMVIRQSVLADQFRGQRVRLSGWLKAEQVTEWAGLWLRIDGEQGVRLSLDNMQNRPVKGTSDWRQCELVLEVPAAAIAVTFGLVLAGGGQVWMDDLGLERASPEATTTERYGKSTARPGDDEYNRRREALAKRLAEELRAKPLQPVNLDFESPIL